jgi:maleate isomerase
MDVYGWRKKFGVIAPGPNTSLQPHLDALRPPGVTNHISRLEIANKPMGTPEEFHALMSDVNASLERAVDVAMTCEPDHLIIGIAADSIWGGGFDKVKEVKDRIAARIAHAGSSIDVTMPADAIAHAFKALNVGKNIAVISPSLPGIDANLHELYESLGCRLVRSKHLGIKLSPLIAQVPEAVLRDAIRELDGDDIDAIVQIGANLPFRRVAVEAENWLGKPVLAVNTVSYWHALRTSGINDKVYQEGRLLAEF